MNLLFPLLYYLLLQFKLSYGLESSHSNPHFLRSQLSIQPKFKGEVQSYTIVLEGSHHTDDNEIVHIKDGIMREGGVIVKVIEEPYMSGWLVMMKSDLADWLKSDSYRTFIKTIWLNNYQSSQNTPPSTTMTLSSSPYPTVVRTNYQLKSNLMNKLSGWGEKFKKKFTNFTKKIKS